MSYVTRALPPPDRATLNQEVPPTSRRKFTVRETLRQLLMQHSVPNGGTPVDDFYFHRSDGSVVRWSRTGEVETIKPPHKERD